MSATESNFGEKRVREDEAVARALRGGGVGDMYGERVTWRGHGWTVADVQNDGQHVHLTLTNPRSEPWSYRTTNDG